MSNFLITTLGVTRSVTLVARRGNSVTFIIDGETYTVEVAHASPLPATSLTSTTTRAEPPRTSSPASSFKNGEVLSLMPGVVTQVLVSEGDLVKKGSPLVVLEAMKMESPVLAPEDAKVIKVHVKTGEEVGNHATLVTLE